jgi:nicotinamidase-related amidase
MRTGVIILDMAKGYGWKPGAYGYDMVDRVKKFKEAAYDAGLQVFHVNSMRRPSDNVGNPTMKEGTDALNVIDELQPVDKDILVFKRYLSGFSFNDLEYNLRNLGIDTVVIAGASTDNTVLWTAADAFQLRFNVAVVDDCTMVHRQSEPPEVQTYALRIISNVLHSDVLSAAEAAAKYFKPSERTQFEAGSG